MNARRSFHRRTHCRNPGAMPGHARHMTPLGPAPVAVHDDRDVFWEPRRIQPSVNFAFLAVEPRGYFVLQSSLPTEATTAGKGLQ